MSAPPAPDPAPTCVAPHGQEQRSEQGASLSLFPDAVATRKAAGAEASGPAAAAAAAPELLDLLPGEAAAHLRLDLYGGSVLVGVFASPDASVVLHGDLFRVQQGRIIITTTIITSSTWDRGRSIQRPPLGLYTRQYAVPREAGLQGGGRGWLLTLSPGCLDPVRGMKFDGCAGGASGGGSSGGGRGSRIGCSSGSGSGSGGARLVLGAGSGGKAGASRLRRRESRTL